LGDQSQEGLISTVHLVDSGVHFCEVLRLLGTNVSAASHHPPALIAMGWCREEWHVTTNII
jgi:hypothetical protein